MEVNVLSSDFQSARNYVNYCNEFTVFSQHQFFLLILFFLLITVQTRSLKEAIINLVYLCGREYLLSLLILNVYVVFLTFLITPARSLFLQCLFISLSFVSIIIQSHEWTSSYIFIFSLVSVFHT